MRAVGPIASIHTIMPIMPVHTVAPVHAGILIVPVHAGAVIAVTVIVTGDLVRVETDADDSARHVGLVFQPGVLQALFHCKTGPGNRKIGNLLCITQNNPFKITSSKVHFYGKTSAQWL